MSKERRPICCLCAVGSLFCDPLVFSWAHPLSFFLRVLTQEADKKRNLDDRLRRLLAAIGLYRTAERTAVRRQQVQRRITSTTAT